MKWGGASVFCNEACVAQGTNWARWLKLVKQVLVLGLHSMSFVWAYFVLEAGGKTDNNYVAACHLCKKHVA